MNRLRESKIGAPIVVDTNVDQAVLQSISGNPVPRGLNAGYKSVSKDLPALPP